MPRRRDRLGRPAPRTYEAELQRALRPMIAQVRATLPSVRTPRDALALGRALRKAWPDSTIRELVERIGAKAEAAASRPWVSAKLRHERGDAASKRPKAYDGRRLVETWARDATSRITSVRDEIAQAMRRDLVDALERGLDATEVADKWRRDGVPVLWGTLEGRTKVIAQHQLATLHAGVQRERAASVGVTHFVWRSQGDSRVRDSHQTFDGRTYSYAEGSPEGLPGEPVNCRCWAESVIPDELLGGFGVEVAPEQAG